MENPYKCKGKDCACQRHTDPVHAYARVNRHLLVSACQRHLLTDVDMPAASDDDIAERGRCKRCTTILAGGIEPRATPFARPAVILNG